MQCLSKTGAIAAVMLAVMTIVAALSAAPVYARPSKLKTIYSFCALANCADGSDVRSLMMDQTGALYGTTYGGGEYNGGTIFELTPAKGGWTFTRLYSFCQNPSCPDGHGATGKLIGDVAGNLYGVTYDGGAGHGLVFELAHDHARNVWTYNVLYAFCIDQGFCLDGSAPLSTGLTYAGAETGAPYDGISPLYGSTSGGGHGGDANDAGTGTIFELTPTAHGSWKHKIINNFCVDAKLPRCGDGGPSNGLTIDGDGALYGPAAGGDNSTGVIFRIVPDGAKWKPNIVHAFGAFGDGDGDQPNGGVALAQSGAVIGTTAYGGGNDIDYYRIGGGTLFSAGSSYAILHSFCARPFCADGEYPSAPVKIDAEGNIFGTTSVGGNTYGGSGGGVLFRLSADATYKVLHRFCSVTNCADGVYPVDGVIIAPSGLLYGTTSSGGAHPTDGFSAGTVFEFTP